VTLVVTGAAGWFGQAFLELLAGTDEVVRAVVHKPADVVTVLDVLPQAQVHVVDLTRGASEVFEGLDGCRVVHAAGVIHPSNVREFQAVNVGATRNVIDAALASGVTRFVHLSSNSPIGTNPTAQERFRDNEPYDPYLEYGRTKMLGEAVVREGLDGAGVTGVILRPPWFYGRHQPQRQARFLKSVRTGRFPMIGAGHNRRSMVDVDTLAQAAWLSLKADVTGVPSYWIADEQPYAMTQIVQAVWDAAEAEGLPVKRSVVRLPALAGRLAQKADEILQARGHYQQEIHVAGELDKTIACEVTGAVRDLGFSPATDLVAGMRRSYRWGLDHGQDV
jgi:nucleoside-diphosphate-sugar epimerase